MNVQVRDCITDHGRVDMLSSGHVAERLAHTRAPQADAPRLSVCEIGQPWCMPQWLHKQMPQIGRRAITPQHIRRDDMRDENQLIFRNRSARHERSTVAVLSAYETVRYGVVFGHIRNLRTRAGPIVSAHRHFASSTLDPSRTRLVTASPGVTLRGLFRTPRRRAFRSHRIVLRGRSGLLPARVLTGSRDGDGKFRCRPFG